ncbi:MAG: thioesterase family protein [Planctomycetota bacterium]|nr:thioesterase family protein [Planctomycetota bacterium]
MTRPLAPRESPDMVMLPESPACLPDWVVHPHPACLRVRASQEDVSAVISHVSNVAFVRWIDHAAERALSAAGWSYQDLLEHRSMFFVARHEIDYRMEADQDDDLLMATWVRDIRRVKSWRDTIIWRICEGEPAVVCTASTLWVHVDLDTRRPTRIPNEMSRVLAPLQHADPPWRTRG